MEQYNTECKLTLSNYLFDLQTHHCTVSLQLLLMQVKFCYFYRAACDAARYGEEISVCLSVCPTHAWIVAKR